MGLLIFSISLIRCNDQKASSRPQEPSKPYPYNSEDVEFLNNLAGIKLAGTLTTPKDNDNSPVVILVSGSGPHDRNSDRLGHKTFLVLSDFLTRNGISVLRYDDRGVGKSEGKFESATTFDFAQDAESAIAFLKTRKEIDKNRIGVIGLSEGAIVAQIVAARYENVDFVVMLAGIGVKMFDTWNRGQTKIMASMGMDSQNIEIVMQQRQQIFKSITNLSNKDSLRIELEKIIREGIKLFEESPIPKGMTEDQYVEAELAMWGSPWMINLMQYDPEPLLEKINCPVLALNGEKDVQVLPEENLNGIQVALQRGGNNHVTIEKLPGINHIFQESTTGLPDEYEKIEQTFSPVAMGKIANWILSVEQ